jgi:hypothetical protein
MDVNKKVDNQINFSELEEFFKDTTENKNNTELTTKPKETAVKTMSCF